MTNLQETAPELSIESCISDKTEVAIPLSVVQQSELSKYLKRGSSTSRTVVASLANFAIFCKQTLDQYSGLLCEASLKRKHNHSKPFAKFLMLVTHTLLIVLIITIIFHEFIFHYDA